MALEDTPVQVERLSDIVVITTGGRHSVALKNDGIVWAWGSNEFGQLGIGITGPSNRVSPAQVIGLTEVSAIAAGSIHSLAIDEKLTKKY